MFEFNCNRVLAGLCVVDIAYTVRREIGLTILVLRYLVLSMQRRVSMKGQPSAGKIGTYPSYKPTAS